MTQSDSSFPYTYKLYGLAIWSQIEMPELMLIEDISLLDGLDRVEVRTGDVPENLKGSQSFEDWFHYKEGVCMYRFEDGGRFLVEGGHTITVQRYEGIKDIDMRAFLFGSVFGTLVHQRGLLPLHVSAVFSPSGVIAFTGDSGAGKSTIASVIHERTGWPIVCDDVAVLRPEETDPMLHCGILRLKLLKDAVGLIKKDTDALKKDGENKFQKFHLIEPEMFVLNSVPLHALIQLERGEACKLTKLSGAKSFECVTNSIYRPYLVPMFGDRDQTIGKCAFLANAIQTCELQRPWSVQGIEDSVKLLQAEYG